MNEGYKDPLQGTNGGIDLVAALFGPHLFLITQLRGLGACGLVEGKKKKNIKTSEYAKKISAIFLDVGHARVRTFTTNGGVL